MPLSPRSNAPSEMRPAAASHCGGCPACADDNSPLDETADPQLVRGWRFSAASLGLFIGPVLLALAGALVAGGDQTRQLLGAAFGLTLGMGGAALVAKRHQESKEAGA